MRSVRAQLFDLTLDSGAPGDDDSRKPGRTPSKALDLKEVRSAQSAMPSKGPRQKARTLALAPDNAIKEALLKPTFEEAKAVLEAQYPDTVNSPNFWKKWSIVHETTWQFPKKFLVEGTPPDSLKLGWHWYDVENMGQLRYMMMVSGDGVKWNNKNFRAGLSDEKRIDTLTIFYAKNYPMYTDYFEDIVRELREEEGQPELDQAELKEQAIYLAQTFDPQLWQNIEVDYILRNGLPRAQTLYTADVIVVTGDVNPYFNSKEFPYGKYSGGTVFSAFPIPDSF